MFVSGANQVDKYLGAGGVALHGAITAGVLIWGHRRLADGRTLMSERVGALAAAGVLFVFATAFAVVHPMAQAGVIGGGSDGDDAINLAVQAGLAGHYPYGIRTYLGNPATYLPGTLLLAAPFVLLGTAAYQNLFWVGVFAVAMWRRFGRAAVAGKMLILLALTPRFWHALVTGSGMVTTSIVVALAVVAVIRDVNRGRTPAVSALGLGLALTTRANFVLVLPVVLMFVVRRLGTRAAVRTAALTLGVMAALVLPFFLHDPATFLRATAVEQNWVARSIRVLPAAWAVFPLMGAVAAVALAAAAGGDEYRCLTACAATQAVPVLLAFLLGSIDAGHIHLDFTRYGMHLFFFALTAAWIWLERTRVRPPDPA